MAHYLDKQYYQRLEPMTVSTDVNIVLSGPRKGRTYIRLNRSECKELWENLSTLLYPKPSQTYVAHYQSEGETKSFTTNAGILYVHMNSLEGRTLTITIEPELKLLPPPIEIDYAQHPEIPLGA